MASCLNSEADNLKGMNNSAKASLTPWPDRQGRYSGQWIVKELPGAVALKLDGSWRVRVLEHNSPLLTRNKFRSRTPKQVWGNRYSASQALNLASKIDRPYRSKEQLLQSIREQMSEEQ